MANKEIINKLNQVGKVLADIEYELKNVQLQLMYLNNKIKGK